jgi:hypothetical protein
LSFQSFDTETINRKGYGQACLLIASRPDGTIKTRDFPKTFAAVYSFLAAKPRRSYVCFNMDFDMRAIVHPNLLPYRVVESLGLFGKAEYKGMCFKFIPGKFLEVQGPGGKGFMLYDLKQFYGMGLAKASAKYLPDRAKLSIPNAWYNRMDERLRDPLTRPRLLAYAIQDVDSTEGLKDKLLISLNALGLKTKRLSSCASLARTRYSNILEKVRAPDYVNKAFERGFFGGRIECNRLGVVKGVKLYDINSAYPSEIAKLKDPTKGEHVESKTGSRSSRVDYGLYLVEAAIPRSERFGPVAVRKSGGVFYPVGHVRTWVCRPGLEALRENRFPVKVLKAYEILDCPQGPIFPDIEALYLKRKNSDVGLAIKLCLNAIYGLTAEATNYLAEDPTSSRLAGGRNVASRSRYGKLTNFVLAAQITEAVRMRLWKEARGFGDGVHFMATDGLLVDESCTLPVGPNLGEWGLKGTFDDAVILGCGRYLLRGKRGSKPGDEGHEEFHLRGFPVRRDLFDKLARCKRKRAYIKSLDTLSLREWATDLMADSLNVLAPSSKRLEVNDEKRYWLQKLPAVKDYFSATVESMPFIAGRLSDF